MEDLLLQFSHGKLTETTTNSPKLSTRTKRPHSRVGLICQDGDYDRLSLLSGQFPEMGPPRSHLRYAPERCRFRRVFLMFSS